MIKKIAIAVSLSLLLAGCGFIHPYRPDIQQGNILNQQQVKKLHVGMTKYQVQNLLGDPVINDTFDHNQLLYAYTNEPNRGKMVQKKLILTFKNNRLVKIDS